MKYTDLHLLKESLWAACRPIHSMKNDPSLTGGRTDPGMI